MSIQLFFFSFQTNFNVTVVSASRNTQSATAARIAPMVPTKITARNTPATRNFLSPVKVADAFQRPGNVTDRWVSTNWSHWFLNNWTLTESLQVDCDDGSDEFGHCAATTCNPKMFTCKNSLCIDTLLVCNLIDDCGDGSDELECSKSGEEVKVACGDYEYRCLQSNKCISMDARWEFY